MASSDDAVREINLNGKQLVFLFMAVTVVSVVIFLFGVLVGRGVQTGTTAAVTTPLPDDTADVPPAEGVPAGAPSEPTKVSGLEYPERLEGSGLTQEKLTPRDTAAKPAPPATPATAPTEPARVPPATEAPNPATPTPSPAVATATGASPLPPEPKGDGFAIQVSALRGREEAEAVVARLKQKGYSAYVLAPLAGQPSVFRVRIGKFKARAEAEQVATRLEREEQFKPWITR